MLDFLLLIGLFAIIGTGYLIWKLGRKAHHAGLPEATGRRREDARDWQRRFGKESVLTANFLQPTQNEILETLCVLDHLTPAWDAGSDESVENHFLNELALNFPSLRKPSCAFPLPFAESLAAKSLSGSAKRKQAATEEEIAAKRESFRIGRAQLNALEQIVAGSPVGPVQVTPGSLPFRASSDRPVSRAENPWPARFAWAAAGIAVFLGVSYFFDISPGVKTARNPHLESSTTPAPAAVKPAPVASETAEIVAAVTATAIPQTVAAATPATVSTPPPPVGPSAEQMALHSQIAASQQRAVGKYPDLAVEGSEINLRFVFRYKNLVQQNSPRLHEPNWPEQLAEECAIAAGVAIKRNGLTQVLGTRH